MGPRDNLIPTGLSGGFFIYNAEGDQEICYAEQNVIELFGCSTMAEFRELTHNSFLGIVHPDDLSKIQNDINAQTFTSEKRHDYVRYRILTKQGTTRYVEDFGHLLHGADGKKYFYVFIVDVDKDEYFNRGRNSMAESQVLSSMHNTDRLTGLMNMRTFYREVQESLLDVVPRPESVVFAHFNIVSFKVFNDEYGFQRGDDLLCRIAFALSAEFPDAYVARFSNDHFVVCDTCDLTTMEEHVAAIHNTALHVIDGIRVETKAGIYQLEDTCKEVGVACDRARLACNTIKRRYDRVYGVYDAAFYERLRLQQYVVDNLDRAIEQSFLKVYYQPIIRIETGRICGYEALVRWDDPTMGFLPPAQFIGTLEEYRLIHKVDCFVLQQICEDMSLLIAQGEPVVPVSVNLSRIDFDQCDIFQISEHNRMLYGIERGMIDIEITESALNEDSVQMVTAIKQFRNAGYRIWVDDFGSGYSALNSLLGYDFDVLKLDLEFLRTYDEHPRAGELIGNIVHVAYDMGVTPLQEGVECEEHLELLRRVGCNMAQGYHFARPMPLAESRAYTRSKGFTWE